LGTLAQSASVAQASVVPFGQAFMAVATAQVAPPPPKPLQQSEPVGQLPGVHASARQVIGPMPAIPPAPAGAWQV
jgi:hypothetical protein